MKERNPARHRSALVDPPERPRGRKARPVEQPPSLTVLITPHAKERMAERGIVDKDIWIILDRPDALEPSVGRRAVARKYCGARTLEVIFSREGKVALIQTAYWLERAG